MVFQLIAVLVLPLIWGVNGIWLSVVVAEFAAAALSMLFIWIKRRKYRI
jgi:Na+-driven multidrug efflux pump